MAMTPLTPKQRERIYRRAAARFAFRDDVVNAWGKHFEYDKTEMEKKFPEAYLINGDLGGLTIGTEFAKLNKSIMLLFAAEMCRTSTQ